MCVCFITYGTWKCSIVVTRAIIIFLISIFKSISINLAAWKKPNKIEDAICKKN